MDREQTTEAKPNQGKFFGAVYVAAVRKGAEYQVLFLLCHLVALRRAIKRDLHRCIFL